MAMAQALLGAPCQAAVLLVLLLLVSARQLRGLRAASYCKAKLAEEGFGLEDASWADPVQTMDLSAELAELLEKNAVQREDYFQRDGPLRGRLLPFLVKGGSEGPAILSAIGSNASLASRNGNATYLVLGLSLLNPLKPSGLRGVYELPQAEVTFYVGIGEADFFDYSDDESTPPRWRASAGYLMPFRPKKQKRCADQSSGNTDDYLSEAHLVCLELCRSERFTWAGDCHDQDLMGVSLTLPAGRDAHFLSAEGTMESLPLEGDSLRFQPTALTTWVWEGKYKYSLLHEVASWCPAVDSSGVVGASERYTTNASSCQLGIVGTLSRSEWGTPPGGPNVHLHMFKGWARRWEPPAWKLSMHATLSPTCRQGTGSYLECGPFAGLSIVSAVVLEKHKFDCSAGRFSASFVITATKPQPFSWEQGGLSAGDWNETKSEEILFEFAAEGLVDVSGTSLCMVACWKRPRQDPDSAEICEDCRIGIKLQIPGSNLTILDRNTVTVTLRSLRMETDPFFFKALTFRGHLDVEEDEVNLAGVASTYEYTKDDLAALHCDDDVPDGPGEDMPFAGYDGWTTFRADTFYSDHRPKNDEERWKGRRESIQVRRLDPYVVNGGTRRCLQSVSGSDCVAYDVVVCWAPSFNQSTRGCWYMEAEGTYDPVQRRLCLIACRSVLPLLVGEKNVIGLEGEASKDCQMSLTAVLTGYKTEFGREINGTFRSLRNASDPLYFKPMVFQPYYFSEEDAAASLRVQDVEGLESLVAISLSILCIWVQLRHSHRGPKFVPHLSLTMLCTLTAGYAIPLLLQSDVFIFLHGANSGNGGSHWNTAELEVVLRGLAMLAVLLLLRLIWRVSNAQKLGEETQATWNEAKVILISVPLYLLGWMIASNLQVTSPIVYDDVDMSPSSPPDPLLVRFTRHDLKKCVGLILDWFLLPQVVANVVWNVGPVQPVSHVFYWGLTFGRSFLHVHDVWRNREMVFPLAGFQEMFASSSWNFLFFSWNIMTLGISVIFAMVVFLQQRWGGRWFCCRSPPTDSEMELSESCKPLSLSP